MVEAVTAANNAPETVRFRRDDSVIGTLLVKVNTSKKPSAWHYAAKQWRTNQSTLNNRLNDRSTGSYLIEIIWNTKNSLFSVALDALNINRMPHVEDITFTYISIISLKRYPPITNYSSQ